MIPKTIDIQTGAELFGDADPVGLLPEASVRRYMKMLKTRIRERFPDATLFVRWSPTGTDGTDVYTIPRVEEAEQAIRSVADEVRAEDGWLRYDETVRAAFQL